MPANTTRVTCEENFSPFRATLGNWILNSTRSHSMYFAHVDEKRRRCSSSIPDTVSEHTSRRSFRYKFRWNSSSLSQSVRYQWWGTHLDWVFPLLFILFLPYRISLCFSEGAYQLTATWNETDNDNDEEDDDCGSSYDDDDVEVPFN